jgi:hypothetical protein
MVKIILFIDKLTFYSFPLMSLLNISTVVLTSYCHFVAAHMSFFGFSAHLLAPWVPFSSDSQSKVLPLEWISVFLDLKHLTFHFLAAPFFFLLHHGISMLFSLTFFSTGRGWKVLLCLPDLKHTVPTDFVQTVGFLAMPSGFCVSLLGSLHGLLFTWINTVFL